MINLTNMNSEENKLVEVHEINLNKIEELSEVELDALSRLQIILDTL